MAVAAPVRLPEDPQPSPRRVWDLRLRYWPWLLGLIWLCSGVYMVPADQQAVLVRFGRVVIPHVPPGLHVALPWPIDRAARLRVRQMQRVVIGGETSDGATGRTDPLQSQFLSGDQNLIHVRTVVQFSVGVPVKYLFSTTDAARAVQSAVESELARALARTPVDEILTTEKAVLQQRVRTSAQARLDQYDAGVAIASVNIESVAPPAEAASAFRDVASARADSSRIVSEAEGYANDLIPRARGEARQMMEAAEAHRQRVINEAAGDADRFRQIAAEYGKAGDVNGRRLYLETLEVILPRIRKTYVDGNVDLTVIGAKEK